MTLKKSLSIITLSATLLIGSAPVLSVLALQRPAASATTGTAMQGANQADAMANLKSRADQEIDRRVTSLNGLITRINTMVRLSASQKSTFISEIQAEINNLTTLKAKIDADTDLATLRTDVQSIIQSYHVYLVFMPQINLLSYADRESTVVTNMNTILGKLQTRVTAAQSAGKNVGNASALLTSIQNELTDATNQLTTVTNEILPLTPAGYPGNEATLKSARTTLQTIFNNDLTPARQNALAVIQILKGL